MLAELPPPQDTADMSIPRTSKINPVVGIGTFVARLRQKSNDARSTTIRKVRPGFSLGETLPCVNLKARALAAVRAGALTLTIIAAPGLASVSGTEAGVVLHVLPAVPPCNLERRCH